jgi:Tol biopolymer transport system component
MTDCTRANSTRSVVTLAVTILVYIGFPAVPAYAQEFCIFKQITDITEGVAEPSMSAGGTRIVFPSHGDPFGTNPDNSWEVFLYDIPTATLTQITADPVGGSLYPTIDATGNLIAFPSRADLTGDNADGGSEVFLFEVSSGIFTQITSSSSSSWDPVISSSGNRIVFYSNADLTGGNSDGNFEIFLYDIATATFSQITSTNGSYNSNPNINRDGTRVVFESDADLTGGNGDNNSELFLYNVSGASFTQVTVSTTEGNYDPVLDGDGTAVVFYSDGDYTGDNTDGNNEFFTFDTVGSTLTQITNSATGQSSDPAFSDDGRWIGTASSSDLTGNNTDGNYEIFVYDSSNGTFSQITTTVSGTSYYPSFSRTGSRIAFVSRADLTGGNPDGSNEVFYAVCGLFLNGFESGDTTAWSSTLP